MNSFKWAIFNRLMTMNIDATKYDEVISVEKKEIIDDEEFMEFLKEFLEKVDEYNKHYGKYTPSDSINHFKEIIDFLKTKLKPGSKLLSEAKIELCNLEPNATNISGNFWDLVNRIRIIVS